MILIPKVKLSDRATWINADIVAISTLDLRDYLPKVSDVFFKKKIIIILPIIPDDYYLDLEKTLGKILRKHPREKFLLVSHDCACYNDLPEECEEELEGMEILNSSLFEKYKIDYGLLKGYSKESYEETRLSLFSDVERYMLYLTGEIRSNPRWFNIKSWLLEIFPFGLDKQVLLHGCPISQFSILKEVNIDVEGVITAGFIADAIYRMSRAWKRETRIKKSWQKWQDAFYQLGD